MHYSYIENVISKNIYFIIISSICLWGKTQTNYEKMAFYNGYKYIIMSKGKKKIYVLKIYF